MANRGSNFDDISKSPNQNNQERERQRNGLQSVIRVFSALPCFPSYEPPPATPNIDQLKEIYNRFRRQDPNQTDVSVLDRVSTTDLCQWTNKILAYLPNIDDVPESDTETKNTLTHFNTIKSFYNGYQNAGFDPSPALETFFNSLQIYESVMSIAFVMFHEHPDTLKSITDQVQKAIGEVQNFGHNGCISVACFGAAILSRFNTILGVIDDLIGKFGIVKVAQFIAGIIEVFCRFFNIDLQETQKLAAIADSIQDMVRAISGTLKSIFGDTIPDVDRKRKWGPLAITERIRGKLSKFESKSPIVERTMNSFERFFSSVEKIDDNFQKDRDKRNVQMRNMAPQDEDLQRVEVTSLMATQIADNNESAYEQITQIGRIFQHLETILAYGILIFNNEDEVLNPLLDNIDECTRMLEKFAALHPLYKVLCGTNYLSKLKVMVKNIMALLDNSKLKVNSPKEFLTELRQRYPDLLYLLCESFLNDTLKKKLEFLPDPLENALNDALNGALNKFKNKFKF